MSRLSMPDHRSYADPGVGNSQANTGRSRARSKQPMGRPSKRLILCEDGTWQNSDSGDLSSSLSIPSNVTRISRAIKPISSDGIPQVVYYHYGVGADGGILSKLAGLSGGGINEIIREGYQFLCTNYTPGDEIFIFGFSRGAFTARSIAGLVDNIGLLTNDGLPYLSEIFRDVRHAHDRNYRPKNPDEPFKNKPSFQDPAYRTELQRKRLTRLDIPIRVVGVWDTVGALGVPKVGFLQALRLQNTTMKDERFYDTALSDCVEYAFQALSLDERRNSFQPTLWEKLESNTTTLRQVWFPGAHANVGGGYDDQQIATITLAWMVAQCENFLDFDLDYVCDLWEDNNEFYTSHGKRALPWSFGKIWDGITAVYVAGGSVARKPGRYCVVDPDTGQETRDPLIDTHEYIHPCVRTRLTLGGPGIQNRGKYQCKALQDWKLTIENDEGQRPDIFWRAREKPLPGFASEIPEAPLKPLEREILGYDPDTQAIVLKPSAVRRRGTKKRYSSRSAGGSVAPDR